MIYPKHNKYEVLYARYFERKPEELLALAGPLKDKKVMDLCGGNARASKAALAMGASECVLIDRILGMIPDDLDPRIRVECAHVCVAFRGLKYTRYDVAICQQGINYWFEEEAIKLLWKAITPDGVFIFNTFNQKPSTTPTVKEYVYKGNHYMEVSWLVTNHLPNGRGAVTEHDVHHVQICEGHEPHVTKFSWISPEEFHKVLNPWFEVCESQHGKTSIYKCVRRNGKLGK